RTRLDELQLPEGSREAAARRSVPVRAAFDLSYRRLRPGEQEVFRWLSVNPGPYISTDAAAALTGEPAHRARSRLVALAQAGLLTEAPPGSGRWRMHDLIKVYAAELADTIDGGDRHRALERLLKHYEITTGAADDHVRALAGVPLPDRFRGRGDALAWLDSE